LHIAFYALEQLGWVNRHGSGKLDMTFTLTPQGQKSAAAAEAHFLPLADFVRTAASPDEGASFERWRGLLVSRAGRGSEVQTKDLAALEAAKGWSQTFSANPQTLEHVNGLLTSTAIISLLYDGKEETQFWRRLQRGDTVSFADLLVASKGWDSSVLRPTLDFLTSIGFLEGSAGRGYQLTTQGQLAAGRAWSYGVPVSYMPTYAIVQDLMSRDPRIPSPVNGIE